jgi:signal peptidase I
MKQWVLSMCIALLLLIVMRTFFIQTLVVQSSSMSSTLQPGDWVVIDKFSYGARLPVTLISVPFAPLRISHSSPHLYLSWIELPYLRLPAIRKILRNDVIAFNYPADDSLPLDKKIVYIKRCVGLPGDTVSIISDILYVNRQKDTLSAVKHQYRVKFKDKRLTNKLLKKYGIDEGGFANDKGDYMFHLSSWQVHKLAKEKAVLSVEKFNRSENSDPSFVYPNESSLDWTLSNYGPIAVPKCGSRIRVNERNMSIYRDVLERFEKCKIRVKNSVWYINDMPLIYYYFKNDYYFVLDDNRDNAKDSRFWGFVPENHLIGRVPVILLSFDISSSGFIGIRWKRCFSHIE